MRHRWIDLYADERADITIKPKTFEICKKCGWFKLYGSMSPSSCGGKK